MCCSIQLTISSHQLGDAELEMETRESVPSHFRQVAPIVVALPHIIEPVIRPLCSCSVIQSAIVVQATLAELAPRLGAELLVQSTQAR
jgi:hypothetical protein